MHYFFVFRAVDLSQVSCSVLVATIDLRDTEDGTQKTVNRVEVVVYEGAATGYCLCSFCLD